MKTQKTLMQTVFVAAASVFLCAFGGERAFLKCDDSKPLRFAFSDAHSLEFPLPGMKEIFAAIPPESRPREFYIKCRAVRLDGDVSWKAYSAGSVSWRLPISQTGRIETLQMRPEIISMRKATGYDCRRLRDVRLVANGTGEIEIFEFGTTDDGPPPKAHDEGLPEIDPESFAFFPEPRRLKVSENAVPFRMFGTAYKCVGDVPTGAVRHFVRTMRDFYGMEFVESKDAKIVFAVEPTSDIDGYDGVRFDGFGVSVSKGGIRVAAKAPRGLVYGAQALTDAVKMTTGDVGEPEVRLLVLVDWPRFEHRIFKDCVRAHRRLTKYEPDFYIEMLERFVVASRFNMVGIKPGGQYRWETIDKRVPSYSAAWTRGDVEKIVDAMNDDAISVFPGINSLGHANTWPLANAECARAFGEDGGNQVLCTASKDAMKVLFGAHEEFLGICSRNPKYAPKVFYAGMDECRWQTDDTPPENRCRLCAGKPKNEIFLGQVCRLNDWGRSHGLRMIMATDMIRAYHNGLNKFRCHDIEGRIPKDIIYDNWSSHDFFEIPETAKAGHDNIMIWTGYKDDPYADEFAAGHGFAAFSVNWWLTRGLAMTDVAGAYGIMAQRILSDQTWRRKASRMTGDGGTIQHHLGDGRSLVNRWGRFLQRNWSRKPIPFGTDRIVPVDIFSVTNLKLSVAIDGVDCAIEATDKVIEIPVGRRTASLQLLHAATLPEENKKAFLNTRLPNPHNMCWLKGAPLAECEAVYEDGTVSRIHIGFGWNVGEWKSTERLFDVFARYTPDAREIRTASLPPDAKTGEPMTAVASLHEWVNPNPEKEIASLRLRKSDPYVRYALLSLSVREMH